MNIYENDIMQIDEYVAIFRCYVDMTTYVLGDAKSDNELMLSSVLDAIHECFDTVFKHSIERKNLISNMTGVILVIDETIDQGIVMTLDPITILQRITSKGDPASSSSTETTGQSSIGGFFGGGG